MLSKPAATLPKKDKSSKYKIDPTGALVKAAESVDKELVVLKTIIAVSGISLLA